MHYFTEILREFSLQAIQEWKVDFNLMNVLDDYYLTTVSVLDFSHFFPSSPENIFHN